jgi:hypothetical protein
MQPREVLYNITKEAKAKKHKELRLTNDQLQNMMIVYKQTRDEDMEEQAKLKDGTSDVQGIV